MRRLTILLAAGCVACGGSPTDTDDGRTLPGTPSLVLIAGEDQEARVDDTLPAAIEVQTARGLQTVPNQLVEWKVLESNGDEPLVTTTQTDDRGITSNRVVAGTLAYTHPFLNGNPHLQIRWMERSSREVLADTTVSYRVLPGALHDVRLGGWQFFNENHVTVYPPDRLKDRYGNPVAWWLHPEGVAHVASTDPADRGARVLVRDSAGVALLDVMLADTVVCYGWVEADSIEVRANFYRRGDSISTCPR